MTLGYSRKNITCGLKPLPCHISHLALEILPRFSQRCAKCTDLFANDDISHLCSTVEIFYVEVNGNIKQFSSGHLISE
jgi:hypothetical protein